MLGRLRRAIDYVKQAEDRYAAVPDRNVRSLAREVMIASIDPDKGRTFSWPTDRPIVAGALLVELVREGRLEVTGTGRRTQVSVRDADPLGDPELDDALLSIGAGFFGHKLTRLLHVVPSQDSVRLRLIADGLIEERSTRSWGITDTRCWPTPTSGHEDVVARVKGALLGTSVPDERTALLVCLLLLGPATTHDWVGRREAKQAQVRADAMLAGLGEDQRALFSGLKVAVRRADRFD